ncbi:MAG: hypothetical protein AAGC78_10540 [Cellvibrio sp.]|uniref:hypothetical protein n=1 Tax=Cellvibrio sp. TaxID=1965322 RepID=UPI0031A2EB94
MNIWFFVLLLLAFALVIGPISMLKPSPAQKRKEQLRLYAAKFGLRFSMRQLPKLKTEIERSQPMPVYYLPPQDKSRAIPEWILVRTSYEHEGNFYREWDWQTDVRPAENICALLKNYLPQLPASVSAISQGGLGTCVFWTEKEGAETLDLLAKILTEIHQVGDM